MNKLIFALSTKIRICPNCGDKKFNGIECYECGFDFDPNWD